VHIAAEDACSGLRHHLLDARPHLIELLPQLKDGDAAKVKMLLT
jgi:hypothetical protein